jgi:hypothetical protein
MSTEHEANTSPVFSGHGIVITERQGRLFVEYDAGSLVPRWVEAEISANEAREAQRDAQGAYAVLLRVQAREGH